MPDEEGNQELFSCFSARERNEAKKSAAVLNEVMADPGLATVLETMVDRAEPLLVEPPMANLVAAPAPPLTPAQQQRKDELASMIRSMQTFPVKEEIAQRKVFQTLPEEVRLRFQEISGDVKALLPEVESLMNEYLPQVEELTQDPKIVQMVQDVGNRAQVTKGYNNPEGMSRMLAKFSEEAPRILSRILPHLRMKVSRSVSMLQESAFRNPFKDLGDMFDYSEADEEFDELTDDEKDVMQEEFRRATLRGPAQNNIQAADGPTTTRPWAYYMPSTLYHRIQGGVDMKIKFNCAADHCWTIVFKVLAVKLGSNLFSHLGLTKPSVFKGKEQPGPGFVIFPVGISIDFPKWVFSCAFYIPKPANVRWNGQTYEFTLGDTFKAVKTGFEVGFVVKDNDIVEGKGGKVVGDFFLGSTPGRVSFRTDRDYDGDNEPDAVYVSEPMIFFNIEVPSAQIKIGWLQRLARQTKYGGHQVFVTAHLLQYKTGKVDDDIPGYAGNMSWYPKGATVGYLHHQFPKAKPAWYNEVKKLRGQQEEYHLKDAFRDLVSGLRKQGSEV